MLELAKHIVDSKTGTFDPEAWMKPEMKEPGLPIASNDKPGNVINLMNALKKMIATTREPSEARRPAPALPDRYKRK